MRARVQRLYRDETGMSLVMVGGGFLAFMTASILAIDIGMLVTARTQAQNSADAGALGGATALAFDSYTNRTASGPAVQSAIKAAQKNGVMDGAPSVLPADVTFPTGPTGQDNRVKVVVQRSTARGNPLSTLVAPIIGAPTAQVFATATAEVSPASSMTCVKPFMIPDKWIEKQCATEICPWDTNDTFDMYDNKGKPLANPDIYIPADQSGYTGYTVANDKGKLLILRAGTGGNINPSFYYSWAMDGVTGAAAYRNNIDTCNQAIVSWGDPIIQEPGNMVGPTIQGITDLIAQDPNAVWDTTCKCVKQSAFQDSSPRVFPIPLYDPAYYATGKANGRTADFKVANFLGFFADHVTGNQIYGYITTIVSNVTTVNQNGSLNAFPFVIRLVQ
jgi:hypothetical protein